MKNLRKQEVIIASLYLVMGVFGVVGSTGEGRFPYYDGILLGFTGQLLMFSAAGVIMNLKVARKGMLAAFILYVIELVLGIPVDTSDRHIMNAYLSDHLFFLAAYIPMLYLAFPENGAMKALIDFYKSQLYYALRIDKYEEALRPPSEADAEKKVGTDEPPKQKKL
jgi:hypothetical protein